MWLTRPAGRGAGPAMLGVVCPILDRRIAANGTSGRRATGASTRGSGFSVSLNSGLRTAGRRTTIKLAL